MTAQRRAIERLSVRLGAAVLGAVLLVLLLPQIWKYLSPFIVVTPVAAMVQPAVRWLEKKCRFRHTLAVFVPVLLLTLVALALLLWFLSYGIGQGMELLRNSSAIITDAVTYVRSAVNRMLGGMELLSAEDQTWISGAVDQGLQWLASQATQLAGYLVAESVNFAAGIPFALIYANFLIMGLYFISKEYEDIMARMPWRSKAAEGSGAASLASSGIAGAIGYFRVQVIYALVEMVLGFIFWHIMGNPYAAVISIGAAILELIPLIGCGAVYVPWAVIALLTAGWTAAIPPAGFYVGYYLIRRFTEPKLMSQSIGISPLLSLIGMFAGMMAGGIAGLIAGPVVMTLLVAVAKGRYLDPTIRDIATVRAWLKARWGGDKGEKQEAGEAPAPEQPLPEPETAAPEDEPGGKPPA